MNDIQPSTSQVTNLSEMLPVIPQSDGNKPRMPFKTAYTLTREQEDALVEHALLRLDQIENQMGKRQNASNGRVIGGKDFILSCDPHSFLGKRERYTARYYNHVADRAVPNTIYQHSNLTASLSQRITAQMIAKSCSFFFGQPDDEEWFTAEGVGIDDDALSDKVKKYARYVAKKCHIKERHCQAVEFGWVRGEAVVKTTHQELFQIYKRLATFLVGDDGEPILDAHGDYILQSDIWIPELIPANAPTPPPPPAGVAVQSTAMPPSPPQMIPSGIQLLKKDGVTTLPDNPIWKTDIITRRLVTWEGPDSRICYYKDFLCPIDASGIQPGEADLIAHLYDKSVMQIAQMFSSSFADGADGLTNLSAAVDLLKNMISESNIAKSDANQPRPDFYEWETEQSPNNPVCQIAECWLTYDADGDGQQEEIMLVVDRRNRVPIFYEYTANVTLRGLRPFEVIRPMSVDGRWYGMGAMEYFDPEQEFIDLQINRRNFRSGAAGRTTFWSPWATMEGAKYPTLALNHGKTYTLREGYEAKQALSYVVLPPDDTTDLEKMIELFMQLMQVKSGVVNGADQQISGLPSSDTATGINEISESGQELFAMFLLRLFPGIQAALAAVVDTIFANLDTRQIFTYFNGDCQDILELTPDDVRDLALHVSLSITQQRDRQILQAGNIADQVIDGFYQRSFILQQRTAGYAQARLKSLRVANAEQIIQPLDPATLPQPVQPGAPAQQGDPSQPQSAPATSGSASAPVASQGVMPNEMGKEQSLMKDPPAPTSMPQPKLAPQYPTTQ